MKKAILLALLVSTIVGCTKSDTNSTEATKKDLSEVPADAIAFFNWNTSTDAFKRYSQSKYNAFDEKLFSEYIGKIKDEATKKMTALPNDEKAVATKNEIEQFSQFAESLISGLKQFGIIGENGKSPRINAGLFYLTPSNSNVVNASFLADGQSMPSSLAFIKSLFDKQNLPQSAVQFGQVSGFKLDKYANFAANDGRLAISTDSDTVSQKLENKTSADITSQSTFADLYNQIDHNNVITTSFINVEALLKQLADSKDQKNEFSKAVNQLLKESKDQIPGGDILALNPVRAFIHISRMTDSPSSTTMISFKKTNNPDINKALIPFTPKSDNFAFKTAPADSDLVISLDGILFENIQKLLPQEAAFATAMIAPYISGTKSLSIAARVGKKSDSAIPEFMVALEGNVASTVSMLLSQVMQASPETVDGVQLTSGMTSFGIKLFMTTNGESLLVSNTDKYIVESVKGGKKLWDSLSDEKKKIAFAAPSFISFYADGSKISDTINDLIKEMNLYQGDVNPNDVYKSVPLFQGLTGISFNGETLVINNSVF